MDVTQEVGLDFVHFTGANGNYYFPEIMGAGVCVLDHDGDGDLDIYLLQGRMVLPGDRIEEALFPPQESTPLRNRLYQNDLSVAPDGTRALFFTDVTSNSGTGDTGYGMGCAVGDYDNDGDADLYVTNYGSNVFYRNDGDGTFTDVTSDSGVDDHRWSTSSAFLDFDSDGHLDLVVVNYVTYTDDVHKVCRRSGGDLDYCTPLAFRPVPDSLFHNNGDGTFTDVSRPAGLADLGGNGLGVVCFDANGDGLTDIYVANDGVANHLWVNQGDGTFKEDALMSGLALNDSGEAEAGMGISVADFDRDGDEDIFLTHLFGETNTLYVNQGGGVYSDESHRCAMGVTSRSKTGFGTYFFDYDFDGLQDLIVVNGAVVKVDSQLQDPYPFMMPNQLFRGEGGGIFQDVSDLAGPAMSQMESSRGAALGDLDLDGDIDFVISNNNGPARVLLNQVGSHNHWLRVGLEGTTCNRDAAGAYVRLEAPDGSTVVDRVHTDGPYCSARDSHVYFGLGASDAPVSITVEWPGGSKERWTSVPTDSTIELRQGEGEQPP